MTCVSTHLQSKNGIKTIKNTRKVMMQIMNWDLVEEKEKSEEDEPAEKRELNTYALVVTEVKKDGLVEEESEEEVVPVDAPVMTKMQAGSRKKTRRHWWRGC